ncbi:hypothetical protein BDN71DRAFT_1455990 [Pleurotus eryngii]|uniref:Uncharacterized protein n=1 Tax=Pleurotus eryngii TaxID=5323 RepID=A0A9P5ZLG2_PLEER|nr:hypothetical protein BDN71DRAFT_1455990 [Pleurotus eryngii]
MHTPLVDSAIPYSEAEGAQFNIVICDGPDAACDAFEEAREVVAPSCVGETRAEGEGPRGPATTGCLAIV